MNIDNCYQLGHVVKVHGTKGAVVIYLDADDPSQYFEMESVFVQKDKELIPFFIEGFERTNQPDKFITFFEEVITIEEAASLKGCKLYLPLDELKSLNDNQFYYHEVKGYKIVDENLGEIGIVKHIYEMPANDMIVFDYQEKELMIPIQEPLYQGVNKVEKQFNVQLPEGYLAVFTEDSNSNRDQD